MKKHLVVFIALSAGGTLSLLGQSPAVSLESKAPLPEDARHALAEGLHPLKIVPTPADIHITAVPRFEAPQARVL